MEPLYRIESPRGTRLLWECLDAVGTQGSYDELVQTLPHLPHDAEVGTCGCVVVEEPDWTPLSSCDVLLDGRWRPLMTVGRV